jgi:hypothetical protein
MNKEGVSTLLPITEGIGYFTDADQEANYTTLQFSPQEEGVLVLRQKLIATMPEETFLHTYENLLLSLRQQANLEEENRQQESAPLDSEVKGPQIHPSRETSSESFGLLRKYDGVILKREGDTFWARLTENPNDFPPIEAEFDITELSESDRPAAIEGAPIVWTIGYAVDRGTRRRQSILYVRRLLPVSSKELRRSKEEVEDLMRGIAWE